MLAKYTCFTVNRCTVIQSGFVRTITTVHAICNVHCTIMLSICSPIDFLSASLQESFKLFSHMLYRMLLRMCYAAVM